MTWDQFIAAVLGIALTALVRLLDRYLPAREHETAAAPMAGPPRASELDIHDGESEA